MKRTAIILALMLVLTASLSSCRGVSYMAGQTAGWVTTAPIRLLKGG
jgi:hypothetical protein